MAGEWFYTINGQQAPSPASSTTLKQLAVAGQLLPTDLVWQEGMANWMPAGSIKGLFGKSGSEVPAPFDKPASSTKNRGRKSTTESPAAPAPLPAAPEMHPVVVLLLSLCTGGLFGLFYAYRVCRRYASASRRDTDSLGRRLGPIRHPLAVLLLSYLTLGIYFAYWISRVMLECSDFLGRKDVNARTELALMLLFPPYAVFLVVFRLPEMIQSVQQQAKVPDSTLPSFVFLNPCLFFALPLLGMAQQDALNRSWLAVQ